MSRAEYIFEWKSRIEKFTGLDCNNINEVLNKRPYTIKELDEAYYIDRNWFIGYANSIMEMC